MIRKKVLVDGRFYYDPLDYLNIDFNDWSFVHKGKFDRIDKDKQDILKTKKYNLMGKDKSKTLRSKVKTKDLRRWGFNA